MNIPLEPNSPQARYEVWLIREYLDQCLGDNLPSNPLDINLMALHIWQITKQARRPVKGPQPWLE